MAEVKSYSITPGTSQVQDFHQLLAEGVLALANHVGLINQPGFQNLLQAAYHRQQALNAGHMPR